MRLPRWLAPLLLILSVLALTGLGCAVNPVTGKSELMLVSEEQEIAMGRQALPSLIWQDGGPYRDPALHAYLSGIVSKLHQVSHRPNLPVEFTIANSSVPNAWAIPGHTAMNRGLLGNLENEAQFAFVMGHEMGHVAARHSAQRQTYGLLANLGVALAGAAVATQTKESARTTGEILVGLGAVGANLVLLKYDRSQELEADRLGVLYMARAGYDPREAVRAHQLLEQAVDRYLANLGKRRGQPGPLDALLSTHPRQEVRIAEVQQMIAQLPAGEVRIQGDGRHADRWLPKTAAIGTVQPAYAHFDRAALAYDQKTLGTAESELQSAMRINDRQAPFPSLLGAVRVRQGRMAEAERLFEQALALDPGYQPALHGLGVTAFASGNSAQAIPRLEQSAALFPAFTPSTYFLGLSHFQTGQYRRAIPYLRAVAEASPQHPHLYGLLGQAYERTGDERAAFFAYKAQLQAAPDSEMGQFARQRVRALGPTLVQPFSSSDIRIRLQVPAAWEVAKQEAWRKGGEAVFRREDPTVVLRVASTDFDTPQDVERRLGEQITRAMVGEGYRVIGVDRSFGLAGRGAIAKEVEYRSRGVTLQRTFIATARGGRVYWVDITAAKEAWGDPALRREVSAILRSMDF